MNTFTINNETIRITRAGYGQWMVTMDGSDRKFHNTNAQMYDAVDDDDDYEAQENAREYYYNLFAAPQEIWYGN